MMVLDQLTSRTNSGLNYDVEAMWMDVVYTHVLDCLHTLLKTKLRATDCLSLRADLFFRVATEWEGLWPLLHIVCAPLLRDHQLWDVISDD